MREARRYIPPPTEFNKPTPLKRAGADLRLIKGGKDNIATLPTEDALEPVQAHNTNKEFDTPVETKKEIPPEATAEEQHLDAELQDLIIWPPHPNLETALKILHEITLDESNQYNLKKYVDDPTYHEHNRPNTEKLTTELSKLDNELASLYTALEFVITPALAEIPVMKQHAQSARERFLDFAPEGDSPKNVKNPTADRDLRKRFNTHFNDKAKGDKKFGLKINNFFDSDIDEMMSDIKQLENWKNPVRAKKPPVEPLVPVRAITQPQLKRIEASQVEPVQTGFVKRTTSKIIGAITGFFKKAA